MGFGGVKARITALCKTALGKEWLLPTVRGVRRARTLGLAAEMSFWLFLSLVPLAAVAGWLAARLALQHHGWVTGDLLSSLPPSSRDLLEAQVKQVAAASGSTVAPVALGIFVWLAAEGIHSVFDAFEVQTQSQRPWWKKRLLAIAACVGLSVGMAILGLLAVGVGRLTSLVGLDAPYQALEGSLLGSLARMLLAAALGTGMVAGLYWVGIPREARQRTPILPGAATAVLLIACLGAGYSLYLSKIGITNAYQGGLTVIGVTLTTLWLFSVALLLGAELNKIAGERRSRLNRGAESAMAGRLPEDSSTEKSPGKGGRSRWPTFAASSFRPISRRPRSSRSTGRSRSPNGLARGSR